MAETPAFTQRGRGVLLLIHDARHPPPVSQRIWPKRLVNWAPAPFAISLMKFEHPMVDEASSDLDFLEGGGRVHGIHGFDLAARLQWPSERAERAFATPRTTQIETQVN